MTMEWQPIKTAPRDGTWILLSGGSVCQFWDGETKPACVVGQFLSFPPPAEEWQFAWYDSGFYGSYNSPTHWMPLPPLPQT